MGWRLDLTDSLIQAVQCIDGRPNQVAAWLSPTLVQFYDEDTGTFYGALEVTFPETATLSGEAWRLAVAGLRAPNGAYLPCVDIGPAAVLTSYDGRLRLYRLHEGELILELDGRYASLSHQGDAPVVAAGLDRDLGTVAVLGADNTLRLYQQHVFVGSYTVEEGASAVFLPDGGGSAVVVSQSGAQIFDLSGRVLATLSAPSAVGLSACTGPGNLLVLADRHRPVIRVYDERLALLHEGSLVELMRGASALQLVSHLPGPDCQVTALEIASDGTLVFALEGVICRAHVRELPSLPRPRALF